MARKSAWKRVLIVTGVTAGSLVVGVLLLICGFLIIGLNYKEADLERTMNTGFSEKNIVINGTRLNYAEGPDNGLPLLLIHGQMDCWESYQKVLPGLSKDFHIFAIDCHGHGKSGRDPAKYSAESMGNDFARFIDVAIGKPAIVSGNSSGGLLSLWLAANAPEKVLGIVLEDPPLFSAEYPRIKKSAAWDAFSAAHDFLRSGGGDFVGYYVLNSHIMKLFRGGEKGIYQWLQFYRKMRPGQPLEAFFLPPSIRFTLRGMTMYDPSFGMAFYNGSWNRNFDHAETLSRVKCPAILIHANWSYDYGKLMGDFAGKGMLMGAMDGDDAARAASLMKGSKLMEIPSGHCVHLENPAIFTKILEDFKREFKRT